MRTRTTPARSTQLRRVCREFEHWRQTRPRRSPIPAALWALAVDHARAVGVHATARRLRLDYYALKQRVEAAGGAGAPVRESPAGLCRGGAGRPAADRGQRMRHRPRGCAGDDDADRAAAPGAVGPGGAEPGPLAGADMIQITPHMRVLVAVAAADFRRGIDGLAQLCRASLAVDPFTGTVFVFRNRRRTAIKLLVYDGQGFWLCHKRLSKGHFRWWPEGGAEAARGLQAHELQVLLCAGDPSATQAAPVWRRLG